MNLYENAKILKEEDSGGHGDKWHIFAIDDETFMSTTIPLVLENSILLKSNTHLEADEHKDEVQGGLLYYTEEHEVCGITAVIARLKDGSNQFISMYPEFSGKRFKTSIEEIELFPNQYEARLDLSLIDFPQTITIFDTRFLNNRFMYEKDKVYDVDIAALAYSMVPLKSEPIIIDNPKDIERHHATRYWAEKYGYYEKEDEEKALILYRDEADISIEPIVIETNQMSMWFEDDTYTDDLRYSGVIRDFIIDDLFILGVAFSCYYVGFTFLDEEFILPFYVSKATLKDGWEPSCGDYVSGYAWLHGKVREVS